MYRLPSELSRISRNIHYLQITVDTLNESVDRATTRSVGPPENLALLSKDFVLKNLISYSYMEEQYLSVDTKSLSLEKLDSTLKEFINIATDLEKSLKNLENYKSDSPKVSISSIKWILEYIVSSIKKDIILKKALFASLKSPLSLEDIQRVRFLWLDSPVSEYNSDDNIFARRLKMLKALVQIR